MKEVFKPNEKEFMDTFSNFSLNRYVCHLRLSESCYPNPNTNTNSNTNTDINAYCHAEKRGDVRNEYLTEFERMDEHDWKPGEREQRACNLWRPESTKPWPPCAKCALRRRCPYGPKK